MLKITTVLILGTTIYFASCRIPDVVDALMG